MNKDENEIYFDKYNNYEVVTGYCKHSFPLHIHQCLCIGIITKGNVLFISDNYETVLKEGERYIIPPNTPHSFICLNKKAYSYLTICMEDKTFYKSDLPNYIAHAIGFIENSDVSVLSIDEICNFVNISKFHFIRAFKKAVGITPYQFILMQRIKKIRQGIVLQQSLSDLAIDYGFSDQSHLCNTFKKHMGVSPKQFNTKYSVHNNAGENFAKI